MRRDNGVSRSHVGPWGMYDLMNEKTSEKLSWFAGLGLVNQIGYPDVMNLMYS